MEWGDDRTGETQWESSGAEGCRVASAASATVEGGPASLTGLIPGNLLYVFYVKVVLGHVVLIC